MMDIDAFYRHVFTMTDTEITACLNQRREASGEALDSLGRIDAEITFLRQEQGRRRPRRKRKAA